MVAVVNVVGLIPLRFPLRHRRGVAGAVMTRVVVLHEVAVVAAIVARHHRKTITNVTKWRWEKSCEKVNL